MSDDTRSGGNRPPQYLYEMQIARTEDLMVQAFSPKDLVATLISEGYTDSEETVRKWRREVHRRWAAEDVEERPARKDVWRARLDRQYHDLLERARSTKSDFAFSQLHAEATRIAKVAIVMDGLTAPVTVRGDGVDPAALAPHEREREIRELLAKREAAQAAAREAAN